MRNRGLDAPVNAFRAGVRDMTAMTLMLAPIGFVVGATAARSNVPPLVGEATAPLIFGASAQLVVIHMLDDGSAPVLIVATAALVSARLMLYGAVMAPHWQRSRLRWKLFASSFLVEQTVALAAPYAERNPDPAEHRRYYAGIAVTLWCGWMAANAAGLLFGASTHSVVPIEPVRVLAFVALAVPAARASAGARRAAVAGAMAALVLAGLPQGTGLLVACAIGVAAGMAGDSDAP
jgi:predicted branched-subunit amino acid permease